MKNNSLCLSLIRLAVSRLMLPVLTSISFACFMADDQAMCLLHYNMASWLPKICFFNTNRAIIIRPAPFHTVCAVYVLIVGLLVVGLLVMIFVQSSFDPLLVC